jgi:hypothetical protein
MSETPPVEPVRRTVSGVELVTIPVSHYAELLECQRKLAEAGIQRWHLVADPRSRIERDPEVATFLAECLGTRMLKDAYTLCRERFGPARTPGRSTIQRYWARLGKR